jgi:hypothetical protein
VSSAKRRKSDFENVVLSKKSVLISSKSDEHRKSTENVKAAISAARRKIADEFYIAFECIIS